MWKKGNSPDARLGRQRQLGLVVLQCRAMGRRCVVEGEPLDADM